jgi:CarD family transcriptional regulator
MFKVGELAVYPAHGVGRIEAIEKKEISGCRQSFYVMRILDNEMIIMIPTQNAALVGLRQVIAFEDVPEIYSILKDQKTRLLANTWSRRYRDYMDKIKTGSVFEVAVVLRELTRRRAHKELSFAERKLLDTARSLLVREIAVVKDMAESAIEREIVGCLDPAALEA